MTPTVAVEHVCDALRAINDPLTRATVATRLAKSVTQEGTCLHREILNCLSASHDEATRAHIIRLSASVMGQWDEGLDVIMPLIQQMRDPWQQATCFEALAKVTAIPVKATCIAAGLRAAAAIADPRNRIMVRRWIEEIPLSSHSLQE